MNLCAMLIVYVSHYYMYERRWRECDCRSCTQISFIHNFRYFFCKIAVCIECIAFTFSPFILFTNCILYIFIWSYTLNAYYSYTEYFILSKKKTPFLFLAFILFFLFFCCRIVTLVTRLGSAWHIATSNIVAPYKAFSREKLPAKIGAYVGLMHVNITLIGKFYYYCYTVANYLEFRIKPI